MLSVMKRPTPKQTPRERLVALLAKKPPAPSLKARLGHRSKASAPRRPRSATDDEGAGLLGPLVMVEGEKVSTYIECRVRSDARRTTMLLSPNTTAGKPKKHLRWRSLPEVKSYELRGWTWQELGLSLRVFTRNLVLEFSAGRSLRNLRPWTRHEAPEGGLRSPHGRAAAIVAAAYRSGELGARSSPHAQQLDQHPEREHRCEGEPYPDQIHIHDA